MTCLILELTDNYGSGFYKKISSDLRSELPDVQSFSVTNLHYMRWFYELYPNAGNLPQLGVDSEEMANLPQAGENCKCSHIYIQKYEMDSKEKQKREGYNTG